MRTDFFDYFGERQHRYESRISLNSPLIIRFDGKNCTANGLRDLTCTGVGEFAHSLISASIKLATKYKAIAYTDLDEVSLIITNPKTVYSRTNSNKTQDITAIMSQELYELFNEMYSGPKPVYFAALCYSIPSNKIVSYLKYRLTCCTNTNNFYFSKKNRLGYHIRFPKGNDLERELANSSEYTNQPVYAKEGALIVSGKLCVLSDYINGIYTPIDITTLDVTDNSDGYTPPLISNFKKMEPSSEEKFFEQEADRSSVSTAPSKIWTIGGSKELKTRPETAYKQELTRKPSPVQNALIDNSSNAKTNAEAILDDTIKKANPLEF